MKVKKIFVIGSMLFYGCSTSETEQNETQKTYSEETNRAFEMIERGYPKWEEQKKEAPRPVAPQYVQPHKERTIPLKKSLPNGPSVTSAPKMSDKLVELNQNLAFYCMKHRKDAVFKNDEKKCMDYVGRMLNQCQNQFPKSHSRLLACVKKKLNQK